MLPSHGFPVTSQPYSEAISAYHQLDTFFTSDSVWDPDLPLDKLAAQAQPSVAEAVFPQPQLPVITSQFQGIDRRESGGRESTSALEAHSSGDDPGSSDPPRPRDGFSKRSRGGTKQQLDELQQVLEDKRAEIERLQRENELLRDRHRLLELVILSRNEQVQRLQESQPSDSQTLVPGVFQPPAEYCRMSGSQLLDNFRPILNELSNALVLAEQHQDDPFAQQQLQLLMSQFQRNISRVCLQNEHAIKLASMTVHGEDIPADEGHWRQVALSLNLTRQQLSDSSLLRDLYTSWIKRNARERQELSSLMGQLTAHGKYGSVYKEAHFRMNEHQIADRLQRNLMQERCWMVLIQEVLCTKILSYIQWARAVVQSYPYIIDCTALLHALAILHSEGAGA